MGDIDPMTGGICRTDPRPQTCGGEPLLLASNDGPSVTSENPFGSFTLAQTPVPFDGGGFVLPGLLGQRVPSPVTQASPIQVNSAHCLDTTINDLQQIFKTMRSGPCPYAMDRILPQIIDHGNFEIQFMAGLNPGTYRGGIVVDGPTLIDARLFIENGRLRGTIDFIPPIIKRGGIAGIANARLRQLRLETDSEGVTVFAATATRFRIPVPLIGDSVPMNVTEEVTEMLFGTRMSTLSGPPSRILQTFLQAQGADGTQLENMVNMASARFRIVANPRPDDPIVPGIGDVSNAAIRLDRLEISPTLTLIDINATIEVWPNEQTGGFTVRIPNASIGEIRHAPTEPCNGQPNAGSMIPNIRVKDLVLEMAPTGDPDQLATNMFEAQSQALRFLANFCAGRVSDPSALLSIRPPLYVQSGSGRIEMGRVSINDDIVINPIEGDHAIRFAVSDGQPNGDMHVTVDAPEMGIDRADLILGGEILQGRTASANIDDAILRNLHATLDLKNGQITYNAAFTPSLASATLKGRNAGGEILAGASLMGFQADIAADGDINLATGQGTHHLHVANASLSPNSEVSATSTLGLGASGTLQTGFSGVALDATLTPTDFTLDRLLLPDYRLGANVNVLGNTIDLGLSSGAATSQLPAGVQITRDTTGPTAGVTSTLSLNTRTDQLLFTIPNVGTFEMSGPLTGTMQMATTTSPIPPSLSGPAFHPVAGSMRLHLNGTILQISGGRLKLKGPIDITDTPEGRISIRSRPSISGLPMSVSIQSRSQITADLSGEIERFSPRENLSIPYYDFDPSRPHSIPIPMILINSALFHPELKQPVNSRIIGNAAVTMGQNLSNIHAQYNFSIPFLDQNIPVPGGNIKLSGGDATIRGNEKKMDVNIRPPSSIDIHLIKEIDGIIYKLRRSDNNPTALKNTASFHATVDLTRGNVTVKQKHLKGAIPLQGVLTLTASKGGTVIGSGEITILSNYSLEGVVTGGKPVFTIKLPQDLVGKVTQGFKIANPDIGEINVTNQSFIDIVLNDLEGKISFDPKTGAVDSSWTLGNIDLARLSIPGNPLEKAKMPSQGPLEVLATLTNPNVLNVKLKRSGVQFDFSNQPVLATVLAEVGKDLKIDFKTQTQSGLSGNVSFDGKTEVRIKDLMARIDVNGFLTLEGSKLGLDGIVLQNLLKNASVSFDPKTRKISLSVAQQGTLPKTQLPTAIDKWLSFPRAQWEKYRAELNDPARQFFSVIEEPLVKAKLPGLTFPPGDGRTYVKLDQLEFSVSLKDYQDPPKALKALFDQVSEAVGRGMIREYPVPGDEMLKNYNGPDIVYNDQQRAEGTFFILGESDTTKLIINDLGLPPDTLANKRIDMGDFDETKIIGRYFKDFLPMLVATLKNDPSPDFPNWPTRALAIMSHINTDFTTMVSKKRVYRGKLTRESSFINFDDPSTRDLAYRDDMHVNTTSLTFLPYDPQKVADAISEKDKLAEALTWLPHKSALSVRFDTGSASSLPMAHFEYNPASDDKYLKRSAGRIYVLPLTDDNGVRGSIMIVDNALGITGNLEFLQGQDRDFGENADPLALPLTTLAKDDPPTPKEWPPPETPPEPTETPDKSFLNIDRLGPMMSRAQGVSITEALPIVANGFMTQLTNSLIHRIKTGAWVSNPPIYQVSATPKGIKISPEYFAADTEKETFTITITKETNIEFVKKSIADGFGIPESEAAQFLPGSETEKDKQGNRVKEIPLKDIYDKSPVNKVFTDYNEFLHFAHAILQMTPLIRHRFRSHGTIYLTMIEDIRKRVSWMKPGEFLFRSFNHPMFFGQVGPITEQINDAAVNAMYFVMPSGGGYTVENMANAFGSPQNFVNFASYKSSKVVDPSKDSLAGVSEALKPYYDCAAQKKNGYYCMEAVLDAGKDLFHRIRVPEKPLDGYIDPWDIMLVPGIPLLANGMYSNSGQWAFFKVTIDGQERILGTNLRILNINMDNEQTESVQRFAFGQMAGFLSGGVKAGSGEELNFNMKEPVKYRK